MKKISVKWNHRLHAGHLWVFANEIMSNLAHYEKGELVKIYDDKGRFQGIGYVNPHSLITIRILTKNDESINKDFFLRRFHSAQSYRKMIGYQKFNSYRLVYGEADGLSGLVVDKYGDYLSVQVLTAGMERLLPLFKEVLIDVFSPKAIVLKNDTTIRELEGLSLTKEVVYGKVERLPVIEEDGVFYEIDIINGQKTGFFLDQRANRLYVRKILAGRKGLRVLDCFSYSGGWALSVASEVEEVVLTAVDISNKAVEIIRRNAEINHKDINVVKADAFNFMREEKAKKASYDVIILDPPAFIKSKSKIKEGIKGYKEVNLTAMKLIRNSGILVTSSCSHHLSREMFYQVLVDAAKDSKKSFKIIKIGGQSPDHPLLLSMPETEYLKTFFLFFTE